MHVKKAIERLGYRFSDSIQNKRAMKIDDKDLEALKSIAEFYEKLFTLGSRSNQMLFKMYVQLRGQMISKYKCDPMDELAQKATRQTLNRSVDCFIDSFCDLVNLVDYEKICHKKGMISKHPALMTEQERRHNLIQLSKMNEEEKNILMGDHWAKEDVIDNLLAELNQILNS